MIVAMRINQAKLGSNGRYTFPYQKFGLNEYIVDKIGLPIAGTQHQTMKEFIQYT